jgi:hypothetical protein
LAKAKAQLGLIRKNIGSDSAVEQTKTIKLINDICKKIRATEVKRTFSISKQLK